MIEKLQEGEFRESIISAKLNELIEKFNNHIHGVEAQDRSITTIPKEELK